MKAKELLDRHEVAHYVGLDISTVYRLMKQGQFPANVSPTGGRNKRWVKQEVDAWIEGLKAKRKKR